MLQKGLTVTWRVAVLLTIVIIKGKPVYYCYVISKNDSDVRKDLPNAQKAGILHIVSILDGSQTIRLAPF